MFPAIIKRNPYKWSRYIPCLSSLYHPWICFWIWFYKFTSSETNSILYTFVHKVVPASIFAFVCNLSLAFYAEFFVPKHFASRFRHANCNSERTLPSLAILLRNRSKFGACDGFLFCCRFYFQEKCFERSWKESRKRKTRGKNGALFH